MSDRARNLIAVGVIAGSLAVIVAMLASDPGGSPDRVHAIASRLKCPVCDTESIADSPAQVSRDLLDLIAERVDSGWTDQEIIDDFIATYGEQMLLDPAPASRTALLWALPVVIAGIGIMLIVGRRSRRGSREVSESERRRIARAIEERTR